MSDLKIKQAHLDANPDLSNHYKVGDTYHLGGGACDKTNPSDPHYGQAGDYDSDCNWIPDVGETIPNPTDEG